MWKTLKSVVRPQGRYKLVTSVMSTLTTDSVFESLSVENVESFGISWNDGGNVIYTKVRLPWYGFSVNSFENFTRNPDGGATLIVRSRMENDSGNRSAM